jgi:hypothetical protein
VKVWLLPLDGSARLPCEVPSPGARFVTVADTVCGCGDGPRKIAGGDPYPSADDRAWECDAVALCCKAHVGTLRAEVNTLFGVREDQAVLAGRPRVYR